jgi:hypothetical protein
MRRRLLVLHIVLIFGWPGFGQAVSPSLPDAQTALGELRKEPFRAHMSFLADDLLEGRGTGKRGHEIAANCISGSVKYFQLRGRRAFVISQHPVRRYREGSVLSQRLRIARELEGPQTEGLRLDASAANKQQMIRCASRQASGGDHLSTPGSDYSMSGMRSCHGREDKNPCQIINCVTTTGIPFLRVSRKIMVRKLRKSSLANQTS